MGCVNFDSFEASQNKRLPTYLDPPKNLEIQDGDILMSRANTRQILGLAALAIKPRRRLLLCDKLYRFRALTGRSKARFLIYAIRCKATREQIEVRTNGASDSMQNISQGVVKNLWIALPPIDEQQAIAAFISDHTASISEAITRARQELDLIREYRTRLIADVVTGKFDVRGIAVPDDDDDADDDRHHDAVDIDDDATVGVEDADGDD